MGYLADNLDSAYSNTRVVNEVYFGRTKEIIELENAVHNLRYPYISGDKPNNTLMNKMAFDPNKKKLEDAICNAFGFSDAYIEIQSTNENNVYTVPTSVSIDLGSSKLTKSAKRASSRTRGYKFDPKDGIVFMIILTTGVLMNPEFTDSEIVALILHEIGHNFTATSERSSKILTFIPGTVIILRVVANIVGQVIVDEKEFSPTVLANSIITNFIIGSNFGKMSMSYWDKLVQSITLQMEKDHPIIIAAIGLFAGVYNVVTDFINGMRWFSSMFPNYINLPPKMLKSIIQSIGDPGGYADEKFADTFARMYGYGPELVSGLNKLELGSNSTTEKVFSNFKVFNAICSVYSAPYKMAIYAFDPHPITSDRAKFMEKDLRDELNSKECTLSAATKKQMLEDANNIQKEYNAYMDSITDLKAAKGVGLRTVQLCIQKLFGGDPKGKVMATNVNNDINAFFDDLEESTVVKPNYGNSIADNMNLVNERYARIKSSKYSGGSSTILNDLL